MRAFWGVTASSVEHIGYIEDNLIVFDCVFELSEGDTSFTTWEKSLQTILQNFHSDRVTKILQLDQFSALITVAARSDGHDLVLLRLDLLRHSRLINIQTNKH